MTYKKKKTILLYNCINKDEGKQQLKQPVHVLQQCRSETTGPSPDVDLGDRSENQKIAVINMLREEADSFSKNDDDIGCAEGLELKINLSNSRPVQKNYTAIPKPLYPEVKQYVEDLLNRGWVRKSHSAYSSPVVCVRKRDLKGCLARTRHHFGYGHPR